MQLVSGALGVLLGSTCPPATCTHTLTPMSAVAVLTVDESFVLVNSPVTAEGVIKSVLPLPLDVLMVVSSNTHSVPSPVGRLAGSRAGLRRDGPVPTVLALAFFRPRRASFQLRR